MSIHLIDDAGANVSRQVAARSRCALQYKQAK